MKTFIVLLSVFALISSYPHRDEVKYKIRSPKEFENFLRNKSSGMSVDDDDLIGILSLTDKHKSKNQNQSVKRRAHFPSFDNIPIPNSSQKEVKFQKELKIVKEEKEVTKGIIKESTLVKEVEEGFQEDEGVVKRSKKVIVVKEEMEEVAEQ